MFRHFRFSAMTLFLIFFIFSFVSADSSNSYNIDYIAPHTVSAELEKMNSLSATWADPGMMRRYGTAYPV